MRTLNSAAHLLLLAAAALCAVLISAPAPVSSLRAEEVDDFGLWVQHIEKTCPTDSDDDDPDDDDRMPSRPTIYDDSSFSKRVREYQKSKKQQYYYYQPSHYSKPRHYVYTKPGRKLGEKAPKHIVPAPKASPPLPAPKKGGAATQPHVPVIVVAKDGTGDVETVQAAVDKVPKGNSERIVIYVKKGIYREKLVFPVDKPFITLKGESAALTYIQWGDTASTKGKGGKPLGTYGSASVAVESDDFIALDISFKNTAPAPQGGEVGKQAVALRIQGDRAAFYRCSFYGAQDTLYDRAGRHYYYKCYIEGSIDFIFGNARSLFVKCHIHSIAAPFGSISAQKRIEPTENTGYSFVYCVVTGSGTIYLGRAWGAYSRVVYGYTYFDDIITPQGWNDFGIPANQKKVFYGEYKCFGPGADRTGRVAWSRKLTSKQARPFLSLGFIDGKEWVPK